MRSMKLSYLPKVHYLVFVAISFMAFAAGCGGDSGAPVFSGSSTYLEERDGQAVFVYEISISDGDGDPYTKGLLVQGMAFTPDGSFPILEANQGGQVTIVLEASTPGDYRVAIESFSDSQGKYFKPAPDDEDLNGIVLLTQTYAP